MEPIVTELPRETRVLDAVVSLVDSLLDDFDVVDLLTELTEQCAQLLDVAAAGLLLATPRRQLQLMAATSEKIHHLELFQLQADQGPCLDCYATGQPISVADMQTEAARGGEQQSRRRDIQQLRALLGELGEQVNNIEVVEQTVHQRHDRVQDASFTR